MVTTYCHDVRYAYYFIFILALTIYNIVQKTMIVSSGIWTRCIFWLIDRRNDPIQRGLPVAVWKPEEL